MQDAVIAVVLEIISAKVRNVHGSWLHVLQLQVTEDAVSGSLGSSLRAETSATVLMQCSVHNCGACAHSLAGHDIDGDLMQLQNIISRKCIYSNFRISPRLRNQF
jgi:hypothetical protein